MARQRPLAMLWFALTLGVLWTAPLRTAHAAFFVCPAPCEAMLLPRDMESLDDCICRGTVAGRARDDESPHRVGGFRCPGGSAAKVVHPLSFADCACLSGFSRDDVHGVCSPERFRCLGRYTPKTGVMTAHSIADCDCQHPYTKDEATGQCVLRECPRAGNYVAKTRQRAVTSLADCACVEPLTKNDQSGECTMAPPYECPPHAVAAAGTRAKSFADCYCDWGFVATSAGECARESASYICPRNSAKRADLPVGTYPRGFFDCACLELGTKYVRNERMQSCDEVDARSGAVRHVDAQFVCPPFAKPLAAVPHSVEQCACLPGYGWKTPEMVCVRTSTYACPLHAYKVTADKLVEESFADCACASGYYRDDVLQRCVEWFLANDNGCPAFAFLKHWPLQSRANCECVYGMYEAPKVLDVDAPTAVPTKKPAPRCNEPPSLTEDGRLTFSECPANALATSWPVASAFDCACLYGFDVAPMSDADVRRGDGELFQCLPMQFIDVEEQALACRPPLVMSKLTGQCRLPLEEVVPRAVRGDEPPREGSVLFKGIEYDYVLTDENVLVTQGDIAIGELLTWDAIGATTGGGGEGGDGEAQQSATSHVVLHGYYNSERDHRWHDAEMCYEIDATARRFGATVRDAMAHIAALTGFTFRECAGNACHDDPPCAYDFVRVQATQSSCYSYIGRIGGRQPLGISADCGLGNVIHVLLHAVGLHHTINHADRDTHMRVAWECVPEDKRSNFIIEDAATASKGTGDDDVPYDFFSIMHHPADAFVHSAVVGSGMRDSPAWCQSLFPVIADPDERLNVLGSMGQRELLAVTDIHAVWRLYPALQAQSKPATYPSNTTDGAQSVFASRLHSSDDPLEVTGVAERSRLRHRGSRFSQRAASFIGAIVTLFGFGAFLAFAFAEIRKRSLRVDAFYAESLLTDTGRYD